MKHLFQKYALKSSKILSRIYFNYNEDIYSYYNIGEKTVNDIASEDDKKAFGLSITVNDSNDIYASNDNNSEQDQIAIQIIDMESFYTIIFYYEGIEKRFNYKGDEKMKIVLKEFSKDKEINIDIKSSSYYFLYSGNSYFYKDIYNKPIFIFATRADYERKGLFFLIKNI